MSSYLTATSRGRALDVLRGERGPASGVRSASPWTSVRDLHTHVEDDGLRRGLRDRLDRALGRPPRRQREPIALAFFAHLTYEEVAAVLDQPVGTVKSRIRSGLRSLYDSIESDWFEATGTDG